VTSAFSTAGTTRDPAAPEVFEERDDGYRYVLAENPAPELADKVRMAANNCPTGAITLVEDE
jgi:ferredoxin